MHTLTLGATDVTLPALGVGTWQWGDMLWTYGNSHNRNDCNEAFEVSLDEGIVLFDTAEIYGFGESERIVGGLSRSTDRRVFVASKYFPYPWRLSERSFHTAIQGSLRRLGVDVIDLYQVHWPYTLRPIEALMDSMADAVDTGLIRHVGVSNFSVAQMQRAAEQLAKHGIPLASNQVPYSLLDLKVADNGVLDYCRANNITLIAYSPLAQGALTGKYHIDGINPTGFMRGRRGNFSDEGLARTRPLIDLLDTIGEQYDARPAQVAINWLARQDNVLPIPGAKNARQAASNARSLNFAISDDEANALTAMAREIASR